MPVFQVIWVNLLTLIYRPQLINPNLLTPIYRPQLILPPLICLQGPNYWLFLHIENYFFFKFKKKNLTHCGLVVASWTSLPFLAGLSSSSTFSRRPQPPRKVASRLFLAAASSSKAIVVSILVEVEELCRTTTSSFIFELMLLKVGRK